MRKPAFRISINKAADQLCGYRAADQRLCSYYIHVDSTIPLLLKSKYFKTLALFSDCAARFVSDLVGNPEDGVSRFMAHMILLVL